MMFPIMESVMAVNPIHLRRIGRTGRMKGKSMVVASMSDRSIDQSEVGSVRVEVRVIGLRPNTSVELSP